MNKLSLLLLIQIICFALTLEYETRCPAAGEWRYRGRKLNCGSTQYVCLFHTSLKIYHENCEGLDYSSTGSKLIFEPVFNKALCSYNRYQPFRFSTDGSSKCAYQKSYCNEKGQYVFHKGSLERDTACGCDLSSGYEFVSSPKNNCYCIPSEEDCTCHKLPCNAKDEQCPLDDDVIKIRSRSAENGLLVILEEDKPNDANFIFTEGKTGTHLRRQCLNVTTALLVVMVIVFGVTYDMIEHSKKDLDKEFFSYLNPVAEKKFKDIAIHYVLELTGKKDGKQMIASSQKFLDKVISLCEDSDADVHNKAFEALNNIAKDTKLSLQIVKNNKFSEFIVNCLKKILNQSFKDADRVCKFVFNVSRPKKGAYCIATNILQSKDVNLSVIVNAMCNENQQSNLHFLASLLANLSQVPQFRIKLIREQEWGIKQCLQFLTNQESDTRKEIASLIKNCLVDKGCHGDLLEENVGLLPQLLLPLVGEENFVNNFNWCLPTNEHHKIQRESEPDIRKIIVECLSQLCATKKTKQYFKDKGTLGMMSKYHEWETECTNKQAIQKVMSVL